MNRFTVVLSFLAVACSTPHHDTPDATAPAADAAVPAPDATPDAPPAIVCDYTRKDHTTLPLTEDGPAFSGTAITLCSTIENLPESPDEPGITDDVYVNITASADADVLIRFEADQPLGGFPWVGFNTVLNDELVDAAGPWKGHGVLLTHLTAGANQLEISAGTPAAATAAVRYHITIAPVDRASLCPAVTAAADYTEAHDGADNKGNDVITFAPQGDLVPTDATTDAPEATGLTIGATPLRIHGNAASVPLDTHYLMDSDTYEIATGPDTQELIIRDVFGGTGTFMRSWVLSKDLTTFEESGPVKRPSPDLTIMPVDPSTTYYLWMAESPTATGFPADYDVSLCGRKRP